MTYIGTSPILLYAWLNEVKQRYDNISPLLATREMDDGYIYFLASLSYAVTFCQMSLGQMATGHICYHSNKSIMMSWLGSTNTQVQRLNSESSVNEWARHEFWTCEWLVNEQGMSCEWNRHELCRSTVYVYAQLRLSLKSLFTSGYKLETTSGL
jgi:hypothetical protein